MGSHETQPYVCHPSVAGAPSIRVLREWVGKHEPHPAVSPRTKPNRQALYQDAAFSRAAIAAKLMPGFRPCRRFSMRIEFHRTVHHQSRPGGATDNSPGRARTGAALGNRRVVDPAPRRAARNLSDDLRRSRNCCFQSEPPAKIPSPHLPIISQLSLHFSQTEGAGKAARRPTTRFLQETGWRVNAI